MCPLFIYAGYTFSFFVFAPMLRFDAETWFHGTYVNGINNIFIGNTFINNGPICCWPFAIEYAWCFTLSNKFFSTDFFPFGTRECLFFCLGNGIICFAQPLFGCIQLLLYYLWSHARRWLGLFSVFVCARVCVCVGAQYNILQWIESSRLLTWSKSLRKMKDDIGTDLYLIFIGSRTLNNSNKNHCP